MQQSVDAHMSRLSMAFRRGGGHEGACRELQPVDRPPIASLCMTLLQCSPASSTRDTTVPNWRYRWSCAPRPAPARSPHRQSCRSALVLSPEKRSKRHCGLGYATNSLIAAAMQEETSEGRTQTALSGKAVGPARSYLSSYDNTDPNKLSPMVTAQLQSRSYWDYPEVVRK